MSARPRDIPRPFSDELAAGFDSPTELPDEGSAVAWQQANRNWWENHPMRYDWNEAIEAPPGTVAYFREVDRRFFSAVSEYLPWNRVPFDRLVDYASLADQDVLEIGVGQGSVAQRLAEAARSFSGIDLTEAAVSSTRCRFELFDLPARIEQMDAERMTFPDESFDFVWSWGVVHHSSNTRRILEEISRVLRPGGRAILMVYYRGLWNYYLTNGLFRGVFQGRWLESRSLHAIAQEATDGAIARHYSIRAWRRLVEDRFRLEKTVILGDRAVILPLPAGRLKNRLISWMPLGFTRMLATRLRMGPYLTSVLRKSS